VVAVRFLLSRRWVLFALVVVVLAWLCVRLGEWQFHRLRDREQSNAHIERNLAADPVPVTDVLAVGRPLAADSEWRPVQARGRYDAEATVVVRYQTRDGQSGVDLVTPLVTDAGPGVLVDRGWLGTANTGDVDPAELPAPPAGEVTVTGWVRADRSGDATEVADGSTRAISSVAIGETVGYPLLAGFVEAESEQPAPDVALTPVELPDLGEGPHFFYGLQWWFFGALAVFGFGYLAYDERKRSRRPQPPAQQPPVPADRT
jgi:cytochrome oxidase assembly protein ShyY1